MLPVLLARLQLARPGVLRGERAQLVLAVAQQGVDRRGVGHSAEGPQEAGRRGGQQAKGGDDQSRDTHLSSSFLRRGNDGRSRLCRRP
jgi:hypothetical protein